MEVRIGGAVMAAVLFAAPLLMHTAIARAQTTRAAHGVQSRPYIPPARQPHNSMARDTTPFNCDKYRDHPHPGMVGYCQGIENMTLQNEARMQGRPAPSTSVIHLPALGSEQAKALGYACVGGQAFKKLPNGWSQVSAKEGGWQRCQGG